MERIVFVYCGLTFRKSLFDPRGSNVTICLDYLFFLKKDKTCYLFSSILGLNVHKIENWFGFDFEFGTISLLVMLPLLHVVFKLRGTK
jgi:hypothetical protein